jgi:cardiolipin synthase
VRSYPKKIWFLSAVGVASIVLTLAHLFTSFTETHPELASTMPAELGSPAFVTAMESVTRSPRLPVAGEIAIFNDGTVFLQDLLGEIARARRSVTITNYIFEAGVMSGAIIDSLTAAAERGVAVRLLRDGNGSKHAPDDKLAALAAAGGRTATFRPFGLRSLLRFHRRSHVRAIVVDGVIGYTGGLAFDDDWLGAGNEPERWRDVMFKYSGALARATQDHFNALWRQTDGEILIGPDFYPGAHGGAQGDANGGTKGALHGGAARDSTAPDVIPDSLPVVAVASDPSSWFVALFHTPMPDLSVDLYDLMWMSIEAARHHIYVATPYLVPDEDILDALVAAARRGVRVEVLMPGPYTDAKVIQAATRARYDELLEAGLVIWEYQPGHFHQKTLTVDGRWSIIGSANLDNRSATLNVENVFGIDDPALARGLEHEFALARARAKLITPEGWDPNPLETAYFNAARLFAKQY